MLSRLPGCSDALDQGKTRFGTYPGLSFLSANDSGFQILGTYGEAGTTYLFTRGITKKLGNFSPEHSIRQITGIKGIIELKEGLQ